MNKKTIISTLVGIVMGVLLVSFFNVFNKLILNSTDVSKLEIVVDVFANMIITMLSALVAFLVAHFQIKKEKVIRNTDNILKNIRYLRVLYYENDLNLNNVKLALANKQEINPKDFLVNIDNVISMDTWENIYLEIEISKDCYNEISKLNRAYRKIKSTPADIFQIDSMSKLIEPLSSAISSIKVETENLETRIKKE